MKALGHENNLLTRDTVRLHRRSENLLGPPVGVVVCGVPRVDPHIECGFDDREGFGFFETPREPARIAEGHGAEDGVGDAEAGGAELDVGCFGGGHDGGGSWLIRWFTGRWKGR